MHTLLTASHTFLLATLTLGECTSRQCDLCEKGFYATARIYLLVTTKLYENLYLSGQGARDVKRWAWPASFSRYFPAPQWP